MTNPQPPDIGTDRQLFVDDFWIDQSTDVTRVLHSPDRREPVIEKEYPWEEGHVGGLTTAFDGEKYRMWYKCEDARVIGVAGVNYHRKAYAESEDEGHGDRSSCYCTAVPSQSKHMLRRASEN